MSGIYIPKMKKPEKCVLCDFASRGFCGQLNDFVKNMFLLDERCPLIAVPDHGRLIDADAFAQHIQKEIEEGKDDFENPQDYRMAWATVSSISSELHKAPVVIPADKED